MAREIVSNKNIANGYAGLGTDTKIASSQIPTAYLTTQLGQAFSADASSTFQTLSFQNSNGVSFSNNAGALRVTHGLQFTSNTSAITALAFPSADTTKFAGSGTTFAGANLSASMTLNSNGLNLSMSAAAPGGGGAINVTAGTTSGNLQTIEFANSNGVSFGLNGSTVTVSAPVNFSAGTTSNNRTQISFANSNGVSFGLDNGTITASVPLNGTFSQRLQWPPGNLTAVAAMGNGSFSINRIQNYDDMTATRMDVPFLLSIASSATANTWGLAVTAFGCIYTKNANTLSSLSSGSASFSLTLASNTAGSTQVIAHAIRPVSVPININMGIGEYYVGFGISTNTSSVGTATTALGNTWSVMGGPIYSSAVPQVGDFSATTNTSTGLMGGQGIYSAAISTVPPTVSLSAINQTGSYYARGNFGIIFRNI